MLYLNSIVFTMLRNCGSRNTREALCTDMVEYLTFTCGARASSKSAERFDSRVAARVREALCAGPTITKCSNSTRRRVAGVGQEPSVSSLLSFRNIARTAIEPFRARSVAGLTSVASSAPIRLSALQTLKRGVVTPP